MRNLRHLYGSELDGAIISGTGMLPKALIQVMNAIVNLLTVFQGGRHVSRFVNKLAFGTYLKRIENPVSEFDWLSVNAENVQKYIANPLCGFTFTLNGFKGLAGLLFGLHDKEKIALIPKELPMYFIYGEEDPVGDYGVSAKLAYQTYVDAGMKNVSETVYPGKRHELLKEDNKDEVMNDVYVWLNKEILR